MPMYEYQCTACNHRFEVRQKFSDDPVSTCPECSGKVEKLISAAGFALKGGGWYQQGYGGGSSAPCASAGSSPGCGGCPKAVGE